MSNAFLKNAIESTPRLLALLNRMNYSYEFGSFERNHWWYRKSGFVSAIHQQGMLSLALLYSREFSENIYYQSDYIKQLVVATLEYSFRLQHGDGSYDEWYLNERGWAGPTAYILYAQAATLDLLKDKISVETKHKAEASFAKAIRYLIDYEEEHTLANHQLLALLAFKAAQNIFPTLANDKFEQKLWQRYEQSNSAEGWALEYDGMDVGYLTADISFLAKLHAIHPDEKYINAARKKIEILIYFIFPDGQLGGAPFSRATQICFHHGLEYWAKHIEHGAYLAERMQESFQELAVPNLHMHDDHYFVYRHLEILLAGLENRVKSPTSDIKMPYKEAGDFVKKFTEAGIIILKKADYYCIVSSKKNAAVRIFSISKKREIFSSEGLVLRQGNEYFSSVAAPKVELSESGDGYCLGFVSDIYKFKQPSFSVVEFIAFNVFQYLFAWNSSASRWIKSRIRKVLMMSQGSSIAKLQFKMDFKNNPAKLSYNLDYKSEKYNSAEVYLCAQQGRRFVPQSMYFSPKSLVALDSLTKVKTSTSFFVEI